MTRIELRCPAWRPGDDYHRCIVVLAGGAVSDEVRAKMLAAVGDCQCGRKLVDVEQT